MSIVLTYLRASGEAKEVGHEKSFILDETRNSLTLADSTQVKTLRFKRGRDIIARNQENGIFMSVHVIGYGKRTICFFLRNDKFNFQLLSKTSKAIELLSVSFSTLGFFSKLKVLGCENTSACMLIYTPLLRYFFQDGQQDQLEVQPALVIANLLGNEASAQKIKHAWSGGLPYWTLLNGWTLMNENSQSHETV